MNPEKLAKLFHEAYESLAPEHGYRASAKPWEEVPEKIRSLMIATCAQVISQTRLGFTSDGIELIAKERERQIVQEGWTAQHGKLRSLVIAGALIAAELDKLSRGGGGKG